MLKEISIEIIRKCPNNCLHCSSFSNKNCSEIIPYELFKKVVSGAKNLGLKTVCFSGGEPFSQANELVELLNIIKEKKDLGIIIYSGYTLQQLRNKNDSNINKLLEFTDILIDGQYIDSLNDGISLRGSSNQKIHLLTDRYLDVFNNYYNKPIREIEIHMNNDSMMLVGIPKSFRINNYKISI